MDRLFKTDLSIGKLIVVYVHYENKMALQLTINKRMDAHQELYRVNCEVHCWIYFQIRGPQLV